MTMNAPTTFAPRTVPTAMAPVQPPKEIQLWNVGDNPTDYGIHIWSARSAEVVLERYAERGNPLLIDVEHGGSVLGDSGMPSVTGGYARLELRDGAPWLAFDWSSYGLEQIASRQRLFLSPEYDVDPATREIVALYRVSLVADPGTHGARMLTTGTPMTPLEAATQRLTAATNDLRFAAAFAKEAKAKGLPDSTAVRIATHRLVERVREFSRIEAKAKETNMNTARKKATGNDAPSELNPDLKPKLEPVDSESAPSAIVDALTRLDQSAFETVVAVLGLDPASLAAALGRTGAPPADIDAGRAFASRGRGLQGAELEQMQREMGVFNPVAAAVRAGARFTRPELGTAGPYRLPDGSQVLPSTTPTQYRAALAAAKQRGGR